MRKICMGSQEGCRRVEAVVMEPEMREGLGQAMPLQQRHRSGHGREPWDAGSPDHGEDGTWILP